MAAGRVAAERRMASPSACTPAVAGETFVDRAGEAPVVLVTRSLDRARPSYGEHDGAVIPHGGEGDGAVPRCVVAGHRIEGPVTGAGRGGAAPRRPAGLTAWCRSSPPTGCRSAPSARPWPTRRC